MSLIGSHGSLPLSHWPKRKSRQHFLTPEELFGSFRPAPLSEASVCLLSLWQCTFIFLDMRKRKSVKRDCGNSEQVNKHSCTVSCNLCCAMEPRCCFSGDMQGLWVALACCLACHGWTLVLLLFCNLSSLAVCRWQSLQSSVQVLWVVTCVLAWNSFLWGIVKHLCFWFCLLLLTCCCGFLTCCEVCAVV